jgi:hypothetical protein
MSKKIIMVCMAVAAFAAFVLPATASATNDPQLTDSKGLVAAGATITATNVGNTVFWNTSTNVELAVCDKADLHGKVLTNSGGTVKGEVTTATFSGTGAVSAHNGQKECTGDIGSSYVTVKSLPLIVESNKTMGTDEFTVTGPAGGKVKFLLGSTVAGECEYEAATSIKGDFTTGSDSLFTTRDTIAGSGASRIRGGFLCPSSGMLRMTFTLETAGVSPTDPIGVS